MTIKPFAIQGSDLTLGGVNLQAGTTGVVIPGVTQATNYFAEEVNEYGSDNNQDLGSQEGAITIIDNAEYVYQSGGAQPSQEYVPAEYSVDELDDGNIEEVQIEVAGTFAAADKTRAEASNMWATLTPTPFVEFNADNWTQIPYRPKMRAGVVENVGGGGSTGNFTFNANTIANNNNASIVVGGGGSLIENIEVQTVDEQVPPGGIWRLFIGDEAYPTLGTTVQIGDTVTTSWGTPITAAITDIQQDNGYWQIHVAQDITAGHNDYDLVTFTPASSKTWIFGTDGDLTLPAGKTIRDAMSGDDLLGGGADAAVSYKGFRAVYARMYDSEPTISKVLIYQDSVTTTPTLEVDTDTDRDLFKVSGLANSSVIALVNIYGADFTHPTALSTLQHFAKSIIDNVILVEGPTTTAAEMKTAFYNNFNTFANRAGERYKNFEFLREEWFNISGTGGSGTGARFDLFRDVHEDLIDSVNIDQNGINYQVGNVITISGASLGGTTPENNVVITVTEVGAGGEIDAITYTGILPANAWPLDNIDDGGDDQYDGANYIFTNIQGDSYIAYNDDETGESERVWAVDYNGGDVNESGAAWFGTGSEYVTTYNDSIFGLFVTGANINWIATNGNSGFDGDGQADTGSLQLVDTDGLINGDQSFVLNADGSVTFPDGTTQTTAYTEGDPNVWVQDFEPTTVGVPTDIVAAATSVEYLNNGDIVAVFLHYYEEGSGRYSTIGRFTPTGEKVWSMKFQGALYTDGWGLAVNNNTNYIFLAGESSGGDGYDVATLTKLDQADGEIIWSKTYDVGYNNSNVVVDVTGTDIVVVGYASNGTDNRIVTTKIHGGTGDVIWSKALDGQGNDEAYGMAVDNNNGGEVVTVGYINEIEVATSHSVTPLTGSGVNVLVINRSDLGSDTLTDTWTVAGTGITGTIGVDAINVYTGLTGTVQQGSGATFDFVIAGDGSIANPVTVADGGTDYLAGHKIKIPYTLIGGADANSDIILTVTGATDGVITSVAAGFFGGGAGSPNNYWGAIGDNYQTGSGLEFDLELDSGSTYTEHPFTITAAGTNYVTGDVVTISGALLGGTSPDNDLITTVSSSLAGGVTGFNTFTGTQQTTTYRVRTDDEGIDFSGVGTWTLNGTTVDSDDRMVVVKYDGNGAIQWQRAVQVEPGYNCTGADADIDSDGNIYVCGNFDYDDGDDGTNQAMILIKFNNSGTKKWTRKVQGPCEDYASSVVVGPDNCLYLSAFTAAGPDYSMVIAKYNLDGTVAWQRLLDSLTNWTFAGQFFFGNGGGSTIAVRDGYVAVVGGVANFNVYTAPQAIIAQFGTDGKIFTRGDYDFKEATFSGLLNTTASNITVTDAGKVSSDYAGYAGEFTPGDFEPDFDLTSDLVGTVYRSVNAGNELVNGNYAVSLNANGSVTLPAGGTVSEGYVTSNPTIQLTPARPDVASQKLVIKGGGIGYYLENGIEVIVNNTIRTVGQTLEVEVNSNTYTGQTLYWWINPEGVGISDPESGTVTLNGSGFGSFSIVVDSDDYEFRVRVSPEDHNYGPGVIGAQSPLINSGEPTVDYEHHLHLTTGNLAETSILLGTDNHNVRTTTDGGIEITTETTTVNPPDTITITGADVAGVNLVYTRDPSEQTPTWKSPVVNPATDPYIEYGMGFGIFAPDIDPVLAIYVNAGTLAKPFTQWSLNPPYGSTAPTGVYTYLALDVHTWQFGPDGTVTFPTLTVPLEDNATPVGTGQVLQFGDSTQQAIIFGPVSTATNTSAERVIIQGAPGYAGTTGEGGDVYVWAGPGGSTNGQGGDIKVRAGEGIGTGTGGYLNFQAGDSATGNGGWINIESGSSNTQGSGGDITIDARSGGEITLRTYNGSTSQEWLFGANGTTTFPNNTINQANSLLIKSGITAAQVGSSLTIADDGAGGLVGWGTNSLSVAYNAAILSTYTAGSTITFQDGVVATITQIEDYTSYIDISWDTPKTGTLFPIILKTANYAAATTASDWTFGADGGLTFPDATVQTTAYTGSALSTVAKTGPILPTTTGVVTGLTPSSALGGLTDGTYGPFTLTGVTLSVVVFGGVINGFTNVSGTATVNDVLGTIDSGAVGGTAGTTITITVNGVAQATPTALDLTKSVNKLTDGSYTLANGVEGQIMYLVRQTGSTAHNVIVASARVDGAIETNISFTPFAPVQEVPTNMATLIFTDSAWQSMGGFWNFT